MAKDSEHTGDNGNEVKKLLRDLPRAKASPDFEARLARRMNPEDAPSRIRRLPDWLGPLRRIPAPAFSLAVVVILGGVSYYAFFRSGSMPAEQHRDLSELRQEPAKVTDQLDADNAKQKPLDKASAIVEGKGERDMQSKQKKDASADKNEEAISHPASSSAPKPAETGKDLTRAESDAKSGMTQERAQGVDESRLKKPSDEAAAQKMILTPQGANAAAAPQMEAVPGQKEDSPISAGLRKTSAMRSPQQSSESYLFKIDSVRIRDSIRADSLRRARADSMKGIKP